MANVNWIKITTDIFDDEKILLIESLPEHDSIIVIWFKLLTKAKKEKDGKLHYRISRINLTDEVLTKCLGEKAMYCINILNKLEMIKRKDKEIEIDYFFNKNKRNRDSVLYRQWRRAVFDRDNYRCVICGNKKEIQAHHIIHWKDNERLRYVLENGLTLCRKCHLKAHGGSWKN